ncbi:MAG: RDD family protein [Planctomycetaceae bacterium]
MAETSRDTLGEGAYFRREDYVGLARRMAILAVDLMVLIVLFFVIGIVVLSVTDISDEQFSLLFGVISWLYLSVLKASRIRTVGYWLLDARIVNLKGETPSVFRMTFRFLLCLFGPFSFIFDLLWVSTDDHKQTLRDRFSGTCVIRRHAEPAGRAAIRLVSYNALGFNLTYPQVMTPKGAAAAGTGT